MRSLFAEDGGEGGSQRRYTSFIATAGFPGFYDTEEGVAVDCCITKVVVVYTVQKSKGQLTASLPSWQP